MINRIFNSYNSNRRLARANSNWVMNNQTLDIKGEAQICHKDYTFDMRGKD